MTCLGCNVVSVVRMLISILSVLAEALEMSYDEAAEALYLDLFVVLGRIQQPG